MRVSWRLEDDRWTLARLTGAPVPVSGSGLGFEAETGDFFTANEVAEKHLGEFTGQGANGDLLGSAAAGELEAVLLGQGGVGLKFGPAPGELDHQFAQDGVAAAHALGFAHGTAFVGHGGESEVGTEGLLALEAANVADEGDEDGGCLGADATDMLQRGREALMTERAVVAKRLKWVATRLGRLGGRIRWLPGLGLVFDVLAQKVLNLASGLGREFEFGEEVVELEVFYR